MEKSFELFTWNSYMESLKNSEVYLVFSRRGWEMHSGEKSNHVLSYAHISLNSRR